MYELRWRTRFVRAISVVAAGAFLLVASGCSAARGRPFTTPEEGATALVGALRPLNVKALREILGPHADEIICSGDDVADQHAADEFAAAYDRKHDIVVEDDTATIIVGENEWPLPIPLVHDKDSWWFDAEEGKDEILARRIGRNELSTMGACRAIVDAQREFASMNGGAYAQKFASDPGQRNGLYWPTQPGEPDSPLGPQVVAAVAEGYGGRNPAEAGPRPYHGYCFRMLSAQGASAPGGARSYLANGRMTEGFGVVAWPVDHENSGIMTFLVSHQGIVYQKDLGKKTEKLASKMSTFNPDEGWEIVPEDDGAIDSTLD